MKNTVATILMQIGVNIIGLVEYIELPDAVRTEKVFKRKKLHEPKSVFFNNRFKAHRNG